MPRHTTRKVISQMFKLTRIIAASATAAGFACAQTTVSEPLHNPEHVELVTTDKPTFALSGELLSAYLDNGVTASAGPVFQPAAEIAYHGLFASFWGNYNLNDRKGLVRAGEFSQADWSAGYRMTFFEDTFEVALGFGQSIYFGPTKGEREDMPMLDLAWHGPLDWYFHVEHVVACEDEGTKGQTYAETGITKEIEISEDGRWGVGGGILLGMVNSEDGKTGLTHWSPSCWVYHKPFENVTITVATAYVGQLDSRLLADADYSGTEPSPGYDIPAVVSLGVSAEF